MTHPTDDELLDLALLRGEPDAPSDQHVKSCPACAARYDAVLAEGDLLKSAFAPAERAAARPRRRSQRWAVAAALVLGVLTGVAVSRATARPRMSPLLLGKVESELRKIPAEIEGLRDADPTRLESEFPRVLSRAEDLYAELLETVLDVASPLTEGQRGGIRQAVEAMYTHVWTEADAEKLVEEFRGALRAALNAEQFQALTALLRRDMESDWAAEVDIVTDDVSEALNLRFSEEERVREAVKARYPKSELPLLSLAQWPPDRLAGDPALSAAVRAALGNGYHPAYDQYVETLKDGHRRAGLAARGFASGLGR
jgi:hypothetical protein